VTNPRVILVTDPAFGDDIVIHCVRSVGATLPRGWLCVQLRDKQRPRVALRLFASQLREVTRAVGASLVVNGDAVVARDVGADGVHLGRQASSVDAARQVCGGKTWVSIAAHSDEAVRGGVAAGANAVLVSPVFSTRSPSSHEPVKGGRGLAALRSARSVSANRLSIFALGGVTPENARSCMDAGADGLAMMRALLGDLEPARVARAIHDAIASRC
jgi:thiamine-phosphate pyrophosphorylase